MNTLGIFVRLEAKSGNPHRHVGPMRINATKQHSLGRSHHRMFPLTVVTLLAAGLGLNPTARAQNVRTPSGV
jgi:hypothetical protein